MGEARMTNEAPPQKWFRTWWGVAILSAAGFAAPQLCALIPNAVGNRVCAIIVNSAVVTFNPAPAVPTAPPLPAAAPPEECPPERRLSTGKCLP